jgi:hypothetical protein
MRPYRRLMGSAVCLNRYKTRGLIQSVLSVALHQTSGIHELEHCQNLDFMQIENHSSITLKSDGKALQNLALIVKPKSIF